MTRAWCRRAVEKTAWLEYVRLVPQPAVPVRHVGRLSEKAIVVAGIFRLADVFATINIVLRLLTQ